jgi:hypothetical protein
LEGNTKYCQQNLRHTTAPVGKSWVAKLEELQLAKSNFSFQLYPPGFMDDFNLIYRSTIINDVINDVPHF